ncbi:Txe/YoeB family addiction module toxin [Paraburkholderia nemoris]|nr:MULTISPECIES: Txe/YoeB family addiction module toxin [Paraburkholderia]MBK3743382.1 Txe/YoeB family addiction module toxin [Paraburkholderia aspalathi]MBK3785852.1 Txe/YoeB family addiction module toxin [Paraburkholderia aspalathi]MBK3815649.1 Txe/YoeB family addiction module toxin [Paraburkholderia aspalathi]MBK5152359.1 Txe/YoeB family addiction module toxin [Burkholderia sp. R-69608]
MFTDDAWHDYLYWQATDRKVLRKINTLLEECRLDPHRGTGKPEALVGSLSGFWSRRITHTDRLVYLPRDGKIYVIACRFHYDD